MIPDRYTEIALALCDVCKLFGERQWCLATSGNFSVRIGDAGCLITQSGREKSQLSPADLMVCDLDGRPGESSLRPSAETQIHTCLYRLDAAIGAILHTHSVASTVMSRTAEEQLTITGFEMQKAVSGIDSHEESMTLPLIENSQDMSVLSSSIRSRWQDDSIPSHGFLVRGHGLYAWGADLEQARRHAEGLEFLLECALHERSQA